MQKREMPFDQSLALLGYSRVETSRREWADIHRPAVYKANWPSTDLRHFVYLGSDIKRHKYFVGKFGFRSCIAEEFSIASLLKYGHANYGYLISRHDRQIGCAMHFDFDRLNSGDRQLGDRVLFGAEADILALHVTALIKERHLPLVQEIDTPAKFLELLVSDVEPFPWFASNAIVRAAQIAAISIHLGIPQRAIADMLSPNYRLISRNLAESDSKTSVDRFLDDLVFDFAAGDRP